MNNDNETVQNNPLPDDFQLPVFYVSANDYFKSTSKSSSDSAANTFKNPEQIPLLRSHVHALTAKARIALKNKCSPNVLSIKLGCTLISNMKPLLVVVLLF